MFLLRPKTVKKGHQRVCQQYLLLPLLLLLLIALLPRFHGTDQIYGPFLFLLYHHAFMEPTRSTLTVQFGPAGSSGDPFLFLLRPKTVKKGHQRVCQQYLLLPLLLLLLIALLPRFHGTDQIYGPFLFLLYHHAFMEPTRSTLTVQFGPAGSSGDPFLFLLRPKTVKKGHQRVCQQYLLLPLLLLLLIALLPRFHGTDQIYGPFLFLLYHHAFMEPTRSTLTVQFGPAGSSGDPFCSS